VFVDQSPSAQPAPLRIAALLLGRVARPAPAPDPGHDRELALIDQVRAEVGAALWHLGLHVSATRDFTEPVIDWGHVEHLAETKTLDLIDALGRRTCGCAPTLGASLAAGVLTAWRAVAFAAADVRHGGSWTEATDRAEQATRLCRWIYSGTAEHALGGLH